MPFFSHHRKNLYKYTRYINTLLFQFNAKYCVIMPSLIALLAEKSNVMGSNSFFSDSDPLYVIYLSANISYAEPSQAQ